MTRISARALYALTVVLILVSARKTAADIQEKRLEATDAKHARSHWTLHADKERGFELRYPDSLLTVSKTDETITFRHSIPCAHMDPCDFDDDVSFLDELVDFHVTICLWHKGLGETVKSTSTDLVMSRFLRGDTVRVEPGFIDEVRIGPFQGFRITTGVEGCGWYDYYFPLDAGITLHVEREHITEFRPILRDCREYLSLSGIIDSENATEIFERMLSSLRILK